MDLYTPSNHHGLWLDLRKANVPNRTVGEHALELGFPHCTFPHFNITLTSAF